MGLDETLTWPFFDDGHRRFAAALPHRRVTLHFRERYFHGLGKCHAHAFISADHR